MSELLEDPAGPQVAASVVQQLVKARLLTSSTDPSDGQPAVEMAHESLIDGWPRLRSWVDEERALLVAARRVTTAASSWEPHQPDPAEELTGARLAEAAHLLETAPQLLTAHERAYVTTSLAHADRAARARRRRRSALVAALLVTLLVVSAMAVVAQSQRSRAERRERIATAQALAAASVAQLGTAPDLALHLALAAVDAVPENHPPVPAAVESLHRAVLDHRVVHVVADGGPFVQALDAERIVTTAPGTSAAAARDVATGEVLAVLHGSSLTPSATTTNADGRLYVQVDDAGATKAWDTRTGNLVTALPPLGSGPHAVAVDADGATVAVAAGGSPEAPAVVAITDLGSARIVASSELPAPATGLAFQPGRPLLAIATIADRTIRMLDTRTGEIVRELTTTTPASAPPGGFLSDVTWIEAGARLAVGTTGPSGVQLVDASTGEIAAVVELPDDGVMPPSLCATGHPEMVVATLAGESVVAVDPATGRVVHRQPAVRQAAPTACGANGIVVTAETDGVIQVWDLLSPPVEVWSVETAAPWTAVWAGDAVVSTHRDRAVRRWDARSGALQAAVTDALAAESAWIQADASGGLVATNTVPTADDRPRETFPLVLRDPSTLMPLRELKPGGIPLDVGAGRLVVAAQPGVLRVIHADRGEVLVEVPTSEPGQAPAGVVLPDLRHVVVDPTFDPATSIVDLDSGETVAVACTRGGARTVAVSPDGTLLAIGEAGPRTVVFDLPALLDAHTAAAPCGDSVHPSDVARLATVDAEGVLGLEFSPDSRLLAAADGVTGVVTVAEARTGGTVWRLDHEGFVGGASFSPDGTRLAVTVDQGATNRGTVRVYTLDVDELVSIATDRLRRELTAEECARYLDGDCPQRLPAPPPEHTRTADSARTRPPRGRRARRGISAFRCLLERSEGRHCRLAPPPGTVAGPLSSVEGEEQRLRPSGGGATAAAPPVIQGKH